LLYNLACILDLTKDLSQYDGNGFKLGYSAEYKAQARRYYDDSHLQETCVLELFCEHLLSMDLIYIVIAKPNVTANSTSTCSSLHVYLHFCFTSDFQILGFWKEYEYFIPGLAQMAKNILAIPVAGWEFSESFPVRSRYAHPNGIA
jgi:hypothetical protein